MTIHRFASTHSPSLKIKLKLANGDARRIEFERGALALDDDVEEEKQIAEALLDLLKNPRMPHISQQIRYVDEAAALRVVEKHMKEALMQNRKAVGGFSSAHANLFADQAMVERIRGEMAAGGASEEEINQALEQLGKDLPMTEDGVGKIVRNNELVTAAIEERKEPQVRSTDLSAVFARARRPNAS